METKDIELNYRTSNQSIILEAQKALDELDILLEANYADFNEEYRKRAGEGKVDIKFYENGLVDKKIEGRLVLINLSTRNETIPGVVARNLEKLTPPYEIRYLAHGVDIINMNGTPIRYHLSSEKL